MAIKEYVAGTTFPGVIGRTIQESEPAWPVQPRAKPDAPNVLFIVLDDTGFGHLGCYGSPIKTPNLDRLAQRGLLFNNMHTTALCSPSRSCISNGRNHHSNAMACITEGATGFPGSNGLIPFENGFLSEILLAHGYNTFALGKWHLTPTEHTSAAGPYDRWPLGRGFDRFYGFMGGDTSQYYPDLFCDNHQVKPPKTPEEGYHLTEDLVDRAIATWYVEAGKYKVLPIDSRGTLRLVDEKPQVSVPRTRYVFYPGTSSVSNKIAPNILNRPHSITARAELINGSEGVLIAQGGSAGGYVLYVKDHKLHYAYNYLGVRRFHVASTVTLPEGKHELRFEFEPTDRPDIANGKGAPGKAQLYSDEKLAGEAVLPVTIPLDIGITEGLTVGRDEGSSVTDAYQAPFTFTGKLDSVAVDVSGELIEDHAATMRNIMAHQ